MLFSMVAWGVASFLSLQSIETATNPNQFDYNNYAAKYDVLNGGHASNAIGIDDMRRKASMSVKGDVLEVAVGSGLQLEYYNWDQINHYTGIDLSQGMIGIANSRIPLNKRASSKLQVMDVKSLSFQDHSLDTVIDTFSLCVIDDPAKALSEMRRVVKPNTGRVVLLENTVSDNPVLAAFQRFTEPILTPISKGCRWDVNVPKLAKEAGLTPITSSTTTALGTLRLDVYAVTKTD